MSSRAAGKDSRSIADEAVKLTSFYLNADADTGSSGWAWPTPLLNRPLDPAVRGKSVSLAQ